MTKWVDFKTVRQGLDFTKVLEHYGIKPHGSGPQVKIVCPFHDDHSPSCGVNLDKQVYNCFACDAGGNVLDFTAHMEGYDPAKVVELRKAAFTAAQTFGIGEALERPAKRGQATRETSPAQPVKAKSAKARKPRPKKAPEKTRKDERVSDTKRAPNAPLTFELRLDHKHPFLGKRGFKKKIVKRFGIGFANRGMMQGRISFPIHNAEGDLIAYSGRWADDNLPEDTPRYLLPKGFEKSRVLFNLHRVIEEGSDTVVMVEGFWSVLRLHAAGIPCVSTFGDNVSDAQIGELVKHGISRVILIFDGDEAGREGTTLSLPGLANRVYVRTVMLGDGVKPDTMDQAILDKLPRF